MITGVQPLPYTSALITGGDGFVGGWLTPVLRAALPADAKVHLLGRRRPEGAGEGFFQADLLDAGSVEKAVAQIRPDLLIHLAAQASVGQSIMGAADTWAINAVGTLHLARACVASGFSGTFLFVSSAEVYGRSFNQGTVTEVSPLDPQSAYARSKAAAEAILDDVLPQEAQLIVTRPANHSGAGQDTRFVLPSFAAQIAAAEQASDPVLRVGNLDAERDFLDVRDVVTAYVSLLRVAPTLRRRETFNIASGSPIAIETLLQSLLTLTQAKIRVEQDPARMRPSEIATTRIAAQHIRSIAGWEPVHPVNTMLRDILQDARHKAFGDPPDMPGRSRDTLGGK